MITEDQIAWLRGLADSGVLSDLESESIRDAVGEIARLRASLAAAGRLLDEGVEIVKALGSEQDRLAARLDRVLSAHISDRGEEEGPLRFRAQFPTPRGFLVFRGFRTLAEAQAAVEAVWGSEKGVDPCA